MIEIELPDGTILEAPDNADVSAVAKNYLARRQKPAAYDPTEGMSVADKFLAGAGKAFVDIGRGVRQVFNAGNAVQITPELQRDDPEGYEFIAGEKEKEKALQSEIEESRRLEAPLMASKNEVLGMDVRPAVWGNVTGNIAASLPAAFVPGANTAVGSSAIGGLLGALQPTTEGESRATNTILGGLLGAAGHGVGKAIGAGVSGAKERISALPSRTTSSALDKIAKQFKRDKLSHADVLSRIDEVGPGGVLADVGGANTTGLARAVASTPGTGKEIAQRSLDARQLGQSGRVSKEISDSLGSGELFYKNIDDLLEARAKDSARFYEKAVKGSNLIPKKEFSNIQRDDFITGIMEKVKSDPLYKLGGLPNNSMKVVDATKKYIDRLIYSAKRGNNPNNYEISQLVAKSKKLRDIADDAFPDYKLARAKFAGPTELVESLENGRKFIKGDAEVTKAALDAMSESERQFFRIGAARALRDKVLGTPDTADAVKKIFNTPLMREKLATVFPSAKEFADFEKLLKSEAKMFQTRSNVLAGSRTAPLLDEMSDLGQNAAEGAGILLNLARGNIGSAALGALRKVTSPRKLSPAESAELGNMLFTQNPRAVAAQAFNKSYRAPGLLSPTRGLARLGLFEDPRAAQVLGLLGPSIYAGQQ